MGELQICPLQRVPLPLTLPSSPSTDRFAQHRALVMGFPSLPNTTIVFFFFCQEKLKKADLERAEVSDGLTGVCWVPTALNTRLISALRHTAGRGSSLRKLLLRNQHLCDVIINLIFPVSLPPAALAPILRD